MKIIVDIAQKHIEVVMPGYTASKGTADFVFAPYDGILKCLKDLIRLKQQGSVLISRRLAAGITQPTPLIGFVAEQLGMKGFQTTVLTVFRIEILYWKRHYIICNYDASFRFSEEIILWSSKFNFIELDDAYSTGSSIMPPRSDIAELTRGKTGKCMEYMGF